METADGEPRGYEFTDVQNATIERAARWIGFWSWIAIVTGFLTGIVPVLTGENMVGGIVTAVVYVLIGMYFRDSAASMRSVVETEGDDIPHLMSAVDKLASAFKVMGVLVILAVVVGLVAGIRGAL